MNKKMDKKVGPLESEDIRIDYDHLDVSDIMGQIKKKIDSRPKDESVSSVSEKKMQAESSLNPPEFEESGFSPSKTKRRMLKLMKPFSPIIKLLVLPVHQELRETIHILDRTNKRVDSLDDEINRVPRKTKEYIRLLHNLSHNIVVEMTKLKIEEENLKIRIRILEKDFEHLKSREKALESRVNQ